MKYPVTLPCLKCKGLTLFISNKKTRMSSMFRIGSFYCAQCNKFDKIFLHQQYFKTGETSYYRFYTFIEFERTNYD